MAEQRLEADCESLLCLVERRPVRLRRCVWWPVVGRLLDTDRDRVSAMMSDVTLLIADEHKLIRTHRQETFFCAVLLCLDRVDAEVDRLECAELPKLQDLMSGVLRSFARAPPGSDDARLRTVSHTYAATVDVLQRAGRLRDLRRRLRVTSEVMHTSFARQRRSRRRDAPVKGVGELDGAL